MTGDSPRPPDYAHRWVGAVMPALLGGGDPAVLPPPARSAEHTVVLVVDGLGWSMGDQAATPSLAALDGGPIDTTVPSTTATALTSITTGRSPAEHGVIGYRMRVAGQVLTTLSWNPNRGPDPQRVQPYPPFAGRVVPVVTCAEFRDSGLTRAHLRGSDLHGWRVPSTMVEHTRLLVDDGAPLVYAYYDGLDKVGHEFGPASSFAARELAAVDALVAALRADLPPTCALVVTADHGMVAAPPEHQHDLEPLSPLVSAWSGEGRLRSLHAAPGRLPDLLAACQERYGDVAWVCSREQVIAEGWLGGTPSAEVAGRIGDVVLASRGLATFIAPDLRREASLRGAHGSLTADEVQVPLLAGPGHAACRF